MKVKAETLPQTSNRSRGVEHLRESQNPCLAWVLGDLSHAIYSPMIMVCLFTPCCTSSHISTFTSAISPLVAIGSSTGGPNALATILSHLPANFGAAVVIVQHVDAQFAPGLVEWLNQQTPLQVLIADEGSRLESGKVLIAATNDHLYLRSNLSLSYTKERGFINLQFLFIA